MSPVGSSSPVLAQGPKPFHALPATRALVGNRAVVEPRGCLAGQWRMIRNLLDSDSGDRRSGVARSPLL